MACAEENRMALDRFMKNLAWLRKEHGLSRREMAQRLGMSVGTLNKIESGRLPARLKVDVLGRVQVSFHIPISEQFTELERKQ